MWLLLVFIVVPIVELYLLIEVGGRVGVLPTIALIIVTGMLGWSLVKAQGLSTLRRIRAEIAEGKVPAQEMVAGLCLIGAGLLLITPGFLTDTVGFLILVPPLRRALAGRLMKRFRIRGFLGTRPPPGAARVSPDGEVIEVPEGDVKTYVKDEQGERWI